MYKKISIAIIILCSLTFFYLQYMVIVNQNSYAPAHADAIVILGHSLKAGEELPSDWLVERLETGYKLYNQNFADTIIVSGGKGPGDKISVAAAMKNWLVSNGVPAEDVLVEEQSKNTYENFKCTKNVADENNIKSIIVVTNDFHMYRSMLIAEYFFDDISGQGAPVSFGIRKFFAYIKEPLSLAKVKFLYILD